VFRNIEPCVESSDHPPANFLSGVGSDIGERFQYGLKRFIVYRATQKQACQSGYSTRTASSASDHEASASRRPSMLSYCAVILNEKRQKQLKVEGTRYRRIARIKAVSRCLCGQQTQGAAAAGEINQGSWPGHLRSSKLLLRNAGCSGRSTEWALI
jgi:hypothetical protein